MTTNKDNGGYVYPRTERATQRERDGITLRDWFAGQALANAAVCTGTAPEWELRQWFGDRGGITRAEIVTAQANEMADAMLAARSRT